MVSEDAVSLGGGYGHENRSGRLYICNAGSEQTERRRYSNDIRRRVGYTAYNAADYTLCILSAVLYPVH